MERYKATKVDGVMVVRKDRRGNYRAEMKQEIERALTEPDFKTITAEVLIGNTWHPLRRKGGHHLISKRKYSICPPIKRGLPLHLKILDRLHLYKNPLEELIYQPERDGELPFI